MGLVAASSLALPNLIIPYSGRMKGRRPQHTVRPMIVDEAESDAEEEMEEHVDEEMKEYYDDIYASAGWDAVFGKPDEIRFGNGDLVLRGDLRSCRSHLEASYEFGMSPSDAKTLLAGGERFGIDDIEVWLIWSFELEADIRITNSRECVVPVWRVITTMMTNKPTWETRCPARCQSHPLQILIWVTGVHQSRRSSSSSQKSFFTNFTISLA